MPFIFAAVFKGIATTVTMHKKCSNIVKMCHKGSLQAWISKLPRIYDATSSIAA